MLTGRRSGHRESASLAQRAERMRRQPRECDGTMLQRLCPARLRSCVPVRRRAVRRLVLLTLHGGGCYKGTNAARGKSSTVSVAQLVERQTVDLDVAGSNPVAHPISVPVVIKNHAWMWKSGFSLLFFFHVHHFRTR
jgi:hypothetical protein